MYDSCHVYICNEQRRTMYEWCDTLAFDIILQFNSESDLGTGVYEASRPWIRYGKEFPWKPARFCKPPGAWVQSSKPCTPQFGGPWMSLSSTWARGMYMLNRWNGHFHSVSFLGSEVERWLVGSWQSWRYQDLHAIDWYCMFGTFQSCQTSLNFAFLFF